MSTKLSVNINKIATLRNSRGGNNPDILKVATDCQLFGADGITVHPRPDERHIRYADVRALKPLITTEFNIEGNPKEDAFVRLVLDTKPTQVTLVPDDPFQLTSNHGWDTIREQAYLTRIIDVFKKEGIRVSIFVDPLIDQIKGAAQTGTDRIELYTEAYATQYEASAQQAVKPYIIAASEANTLGLEVNAGHDLSLQNLAYFSLNVRPLAEVSIGHALISDALYYGLQNTIMMYKRHLTEG